MACMVGGGADDGKFSDRGAAGVRRRRRAARPGRTISAETRGGITYTLVNTYSHPSAASGAATGGSLRRSYARRLYPLALLGLTLVLSGCSLRKLGYNLAARFITGRIVDTFDLDKAQKRQTQAAVARLHDWHRKNELARYVEILDGVMTRTADGLTRDEVLWMLKAAETTAERTAQKLVPEAAALLVTLTPEQITHADKEMKKGSQERFERLELPEQEYVNFRLKRAKKNLNTWLGSYNDAQLAEFERFVRKNRVEEQRRQRQTDELRTTLLTGLREHAPLPVIEKLLFNWMTKEQAHPSDETRRAEERNSDDFIELVLGVDRAMTPAQRQHMQKELRTLRTEIYELSVGS